MCAMCTKFGANLKISKKSYRDDTIVSIVCHSGRQTQGWMYRQRDVPSETNISPFNFAEWGVNKNLFDDRYEKSSDKRNYTYRSQMSVSLDTSEKIHTEKVSF